MVGLSPGNSARRIGLSNLWCHGEPSYSSWNNDHRVVHLSHSQVVSLFLMRDGRQLGLGFVRLR